MYPTQLHSYLLWRSSVKPDAQTLASRRHTATVSLLPATMVGIFVFGWWAGSLILICLATAFLSDFILHRFVYRDSTGTRDGVWLLTGLLLALLMPPNAPWLLPVIGAVAAIAVGKHYLSVDNMPLLQPVVVGLLVMNLVGLAWPGRNPMLAVDHGQPHWPVLARSIEPPSDERSSSRRLRKLAREFFGGDVRKSVTRSQYRDAVFDGKTPWYDEERRIEAEAVHGPRPLDLVKDNPRQPVGVDARTQPGGAGQEAVERYDPLQMILGYVPGTSGGSSALALGFGILLLLFTGAASPVTPVLALATMFTALHFFAWAGGSYVIPANIPVHLLTGSTILGLFYLAADPTTAPRSFLGKVYAGVAVGLLEVLIRLFTPLAEGLFISVLVVQGLSFVIDQWLAPPPEEHQPAATGITTSSLGRL